MVGFKGWLLQQLGCLNDINWISPKKGLTHPQNFFRFKDRYFSVIMILFYSQLNTNEPSSFNFLLHISLVLYKLYIVWCHCWCIIEQHFVCCSRDWWYRFIRKVKALQFFYFWKAFHHSPQVFWWNLSYISIFTQQWQPWKKIYIQQVSILK